MSCSPSWRARLRLPMRPCQKTRAPQTHRGCPPLRKGRRRSRDIAWLTGQHPGKRQTKALDLIDDNHRQMLAASPAFRFDEEIGLRRLELELPGAPEHRCNQFLVKAHTELDAGRIARKAARILTVNPIFQSPQRG